MKYFIDTEFAETGGGPEAPTIDLISIGIITDDGRSLYMESSEFDEGNCNTWVRENVLPHLGPPEERRSRAEIRNAITDLTRGDPHPEFWTYYGAYDWVVFCWLFGKMVDLPSSYPMAHMDLYQWWQMMGGSKDLLPAKLEGEHHALNDARWNQVFWHKLAAEQMMRTASVLIVEP